MNEKRRVSLRSGWRLLFRSWKLYAGLCPGLLWAHALHAVFAALSPLATVWLSARLVSELAGARSPDALTFWATASLLSGAVLALGSGLLKRWCNFHDAHLEAVRLRHTTDKMLSLDYVDFESREVRDLHTQIFEWERWAGRGLPAAAWSSEKLLTGLLQLLGGLALCAGLLTQPVREGPRFALLNHPLSAVVLALLLLGISLLAPACDGKASRYDLRVAEESRFGNRVFSCFGFLSSARERALDFRLYRQQENVCSPSLTATSFFTRDSLWARNLRGPQGLWYALGKLSACMMTGLIYLFVCLKAYAGAYDIGAVTQYVGAITSLFAGLSAVLSELSEMRNNGAYLEEVFRFLDWPNRMYQGSLTTEKRSDRQYDVEFRDVSFRYPDREDYALRHVNMKFRVGSRLAIVGENGSGKTTFIKLLCRLYDPTEGEILLNGIDIRKYRYDEYLRIFSVVFQDFRLLALPLGENVGGGQRYDRARAEDCLNKAGFGERLAELPDGLDTMLYHSLSPDGVELSGGEAQKVAIARALYKDAPFIILDEPTAALDPIAEAEIYEKFSDIAGDKTAVYISHRLSSCKFCDEIAVFDRGRVVQKGSHAALLSDEAGKYHALWNAQAQYYQ